GGDGAVRRRRPAQAGRRADWADRRAGAGEGPDPAVVRTLRERPAHPGAADGAGCAVAAGAGASGGVLRRAGLMRLFYGAGFMPADGAEVFVRSAHQWWTGKALSTLRVISE